MIASHDLNGWAQSGPYLWWGGSSLYCVSRWAQQKTVSGSPINYFIGGCSVPNEAHYYWQQAVYVSGGWRIRSNIDQTVIQESAWSPFANFTSPFEVQFATETHYYESTIPGSPSSPEDFSGLQVQDRINDNFYDACGNVGLGSVNANYPQWGTDAPSCNHTRTWQNY